MVVGTKKRNAAKKKSDRKKAEGLRKPGEQVLNTIDGASRTIQIDSLMPGTSTTTGEERLYRIMRVDEELDAVYAVVVAGSPMPWWKWNNMLTKGLVDGEVLDEFLAQLGE